LTTSDKKTIPLYSIDRFKKRDGRHQPYEIEVFDKNRDFKVTYPHRHDFFEILFITKGHGKHTIDLKQYEVKPNSIFFLSPGQIHSLNLSEDIYGFIFLFTSEFYLLNKQDKNKLLEFSFFYNISSENPPLYLKAQKDVLLMADLFTQACNENKNNFADSPDLIRSFLDIILMKCQRLYPSHPKEKANKGRLMVKKFKQLIEEKYQENNSVKHYAGLLSISQNHLSETVKDITGRTPLDLINEKMLLEIKRMLLHSELNISEIAYQLSFEDQSYFSKYFKKKTGLTPNEFRIKSIKKLD
jgi:AraC family transcriptional activator of pobA